MGAPDARQFSVYRNDVAVGLIGALEARYPVSRRIAGEDLFRALARAFAHARKPRSPVMIAYGGEFPESWLIIWRAVQAWKTARMQSSLRGAQRRSNPESVGRPIFPGLLRHSPTGRTGVLRHAVWLAMTKAVRRI